MEFRYVMTTKTAPLKYDPFKRIKQANSAIPLYFTIGCEAVQKLLKSH